jgi:thiol-disulfide isomerase/thioredoxin
VNEPALALAWLAAGAGGVWLWLWWRSRRAMRGNSADLLTLLDSEHTGALVLAFTTPDCATCKTLQRPALEALVRQHPGRVVVKEVDALEDPNLARRFGILTVPSSVVITASGDVHAVNHGVATTARLAAQAGLNG